MALVPHKITALAESDAQGTDGKNIVAGAVVSLYDTNGTVVTLFDDANGTNGSTTKQTDATGQVVVYVTPGEYDEEVNGSVKRRVSIGGNGLTSYPTTTSLESSRPTKTGQRAENRERGNAQYVLADSGYAALPGDIVAANGRVWKLIIIDKVIVEWFGAKVDNESSDEVQKAIDRAKYESGSLGSGVNVVFGAGTYLVSEVSVPPRSKLKGQGRESTILKLPDNGGAYILCDAGYAANSAFATTHITVKDLGFDGNKANQTSTIALVVAKTFRASFESCRFSNSLGDAVLYTSRASGGADNINGLAENTWLKCTFNRNDGAGIRGMDFGNSQLADATISECIFNENSLTEKLGDIYCDRSAGFKVINNQLYAGGFHNIYLNAFSRGVITNNHCDLDATNASTGDKPAAIYINSFSSGGAVSISNNPIFLSHNGAESGAAPSGFDLASTSESLSVIGNSVTQIGSNGVAYNVRGNQPFAKYNNSIDDSVDIGTDLYTRNVADAGEIQGIITPTVSFETAGDSSFSYNDAKGAYIRRGDTVSFNIYIDFDSNPYTSASGRLLINGFPFDPELQNVDLQFATIGRLKNINYVGQVDLVMGMGAQIIDSTNKATLFFNVLGSSSQQLTTSNILPNQNYIISLSGQYIIS